MNSTKTKNLLPARRQKRKMVSLWIHTMEHAVNPVGTANLLNDLCPDDLVTTGLLKGVFRHDALNLRPGKASETVLITNHNELLVRRFAYRHGISMVAAADLLFWSGLHYRHGNDLAKIPLIVKVSTIPAEVKPDAQKKSYTKSGLGQRCTIRLTSELESRLLDYGEKYGDLLRKWMKQYVDNPVPFKDSSNFHLEDDRTGQPVMTVSFLPWQVGLLCEIESAFGCCRSQALMKILIAIGAAQGDSFRLT